MNHLRINERENNVRTIGTANLDRYISPNYIMQINPQGVIGMKALEHMNAPGTTTLGGQIPYVLNQGIALSRIENVKLSLHPKEDHSVKVNLNVHRPYEVRIASQKAQESFNNEFRKKYETTDESNLQYVRYALRKKNGEINPFIDKEDVSPEGKNTYYSLLNGWGKRVAKDCIKHGKIPGKVILNYWDSYIAYKAMLEYWNKHGLTKMPKTVAIPHSLGYRKLISMLYADVNKDLTNNKKLNISMQKNDIIELIHSKLEKLLDDPKTCFPARILLEREMFSHAEIKGSLNSNLELSEQLLTGPYILPFEGLPVVKPENTTVITPGIDTIRFGSKESKFMQTHEEFAAKALEERLKSDIPLHRRKLPIILAVGRLNFDKNFHGLANAFLNNKSLHEKANLVFIINGKDKQINANYIEEMQKLMKNQPDANPELLKSFTGSARTQLERLATIMEDSRCKGKFTSVSLPDGCDFAGLQRYLGKNTMAVSGLFSFKEPYGLSPLESMISGIPVVVSKFSGVAQEISQAKGEVFDPIEELEIAEALLKTLDDIHEKRKLHMEYASRKTWDSSAVKLVNWMDPHKTEPLNPLQPSNASKIEIDSPEFVNRGKELIRKCIQNEIEKSLVDKKSPFSSLLS